MSMIIDGVDFQGLPAEKFWSFPSGYKKNKQDEIYAMIMSNAYIGSRKMDGAYYRFIKDMDGNMVLQGRSESVNGGFLDKIDWVPHLHSFFDALPRGTCLLGEIYFPNNEGSRHVTTIMGCLPEKARERQEKGEKLHYYVFDVWAWAGASLLSVTAETRFSQLGYISECVARADNKFIEIAKYYYGQALWDELMRVRMLDGEGIVITKSNSHAEPGKRTARKTLRYIKEIILMSGSIGGTSKPMKRCLGAITTTMSMVQLLSQSLKLGSMDGQAQLRLLLWMEIKSILLVGLAVFPMR